MKETVYSSPKQNKKGITLFAILLILLFISLLMFDREWGYRWLSQLFVYLFGGGVIWVSVRYFFSAFIYEINCYDGEWLLIISSKQGKKCTTLCRMPLHQLQSVTPLLPPAELKKISPKTAETPRFRQNMFPALLCVAVFDDGEKTVGMELEVDEAFRQNLLSFAPSDATTNENSEENEND